MPRLPVPLLSATVAASLTGCAPPFSNDALRADAAFLSALPDRSLHTAPIREVTENGARGGELPRLLELAVDLGSDANGYLDTMLSVVEQARRTPPSARADGARTWGPLVVQEVVEVQLDMWQEGARYAWEITATPVGANDWQVVATGEHLAGLDIARGEGGFLLDLDTLAELDPRERNGGSLLLDYDLREGRTVFVDLDGVESDQPVYGPGGFWWSRSPDAEIRFEYDALTDLDADGVEESVEVVTRVAPDRAGRGDAHVTTPATSGQWWVGQCWSSSLEETWIDDNLGRLTASGDPSSCVYDERATIEHL